MTTHVMNCRGNNRNFDVYIGDAVRFHPEIKRSKWFNPYHSYIKKWGREKVIEKYREYILNKPDLLALIPIELKDKTLGCWCKPEPCHGDILAQIADSS